MNRYIISLLFVPLLMSGCSTKPKGNAATKASKVYICTGPSSRRYHATSQCRGLSRCSGEIREVTLEEATRLHRTPCRMCAQ